MADQLREVLTRVADRAGPLPVDPLLWSRAARTRRRRHTYLAAGAALVVVALLGGIVLATQVFRSAPPPVDRPDRQGLVEIAGIAGDGGLRLERNLAIGQASVAIANGTAAFVVTADDGVPHRVALPGFDAPLYAETAAEQGVDFPEMLSLSPDGTKLIYAWHEPFVSQGEGWVESGARLLDLTTGAIDTYPSAPDDFDNTTQLGRFNWNFRWSPDSRLVAFDEKVTTDMGWGGWEVLDGLVLDTTHKVASSQAGPGVNPRGVRGMRGDPETAAPAVTNAGLAVWMDTPDYGGRLHYDEQSLMIQTDSVPRRQSLPHDVIWGPGRFSPDGQTLLIESARLSDHMLAVRPGRDDSIRSVHLKGDVPSRVVRTRVLGWVDDTHVLAAVHQSAGADRWQADADLALLTLDLDAGTADVAVVGGVDAGDTGSAFSVATDLLAVDIPTNDSGEPVPEEHGPVPDSEHASILDRTGLSDHPWLGWAAVGLALGAAVAVMISRRKGT
jgi:hypothetical protein